MEREMEFGLLGPLVVRSNGADVPVPRGKQRVLLSVLLLNAGHLVPASVLAEVLWGPEPPSSAEASIRNYVKRLRQVLGPAGRERLCTQPPGYLIRVADDELDVYRFEALLEAARASAQEGAWQDAARQARASLALWRGEPLADAESDALVQREVPRLVELRVQAIETRLDADLHLGRHAEVIAELERLTAAHPLREHLYSLLMLALYRSGRQAEALAAYQRAREIVVAELGVEPGAGLRELHHQMLSADPALAVTESIRPEQARRQPITPRELPPTVPGFTGRSAELQAMTELLDRPGKQAPEAVVISSIGGAAGVGKTALAVHWSHQVAGRFPDGQLYVNLRGYDPGPPMPAADALAGFLRSLGVPGQDIPPEADQRAARYRSLVAGKQMLIVLDNAGSPDQVRPLLPGTATCAVLVTSRDALAGLVARDGAARLDLDVLPPEDAVALLRTLIGARVDADPVAAAELAGQCCRLPLALRIAAQLAASRPAASLAALSGELADAGSRLDLLAADGDLHSQVRVVFSWSYRRLGAEAARTFRLLGLHPGPDMEAYAVAALAGATRPQARRVLEGLARAHLVRPVAPGRYAMHDLLRGYARELSATVDGHEEQRAALTRLFDHYLHSAAAAMDNLFPASRGRRPSIPRPATPVPLLADPAAARKWLDGECAALVVGSGHAAAHDWPGHAARMAPILATYLYNSARFPEAITLFSHALGAARRIGDRPAEAMALMLIGHVDAQQSRLPQAAGRYRQALALFRAAGNREGEAHVLAGMGSVEKDLGHFEQAAGHQEDAVAIYRDIGDRFGEARTLGNLGLTWQRQGRYREAAGNHWQALNASRQISDHEGEAWALTRLGVIGLRLGRFQHAAGYLQQAQDLFRELRLTMGETEILIKLGEVYLGLGRYDQAAGNFEQALAMAGKVGARSLQADAQNCLGDVLFQKGEVDQARAQHAAALRLASEAGSPWVQARAHISLARACQAGGDSLQARRHWREALTIYPAIGAHEARELRARLAIGGHSGRDDTDSQHKTFVVLPPPTPPARPGRGDSASSRMPVPLGNKSSDPNCG